jgi:benzylsuccinate CoA-transferase BbsF subunit
MTGWPDRGPTNPGLTVTGDILGPFYAVGILIAALDYRRRTGEGQNIDFAQIEALTNVLGPWYMDAALNRRVPERPGNRCLQAAPHGVYRCAGDDQWCAIAVLSEDSWRDFCAVIGSPALADDPRFVTVAERKKNEDELDRIVEGWTLNKTGREVMEKLQKKGIPSGPVYDISDIMDHDPQARYRKLFVPLNHPEVGTIREREMPFRLSLTPPDLKPAHLMGQDTEYFLRDVLSMSDEEIATLVINEVLA